MTRAKIASTERDLTNAHRILPHRLGPPWRGLFACSVLRCAQPSAPRAPGAPRRATCASRRDSLALAGSRSFSQRGRVSRLSPGSARDGTSELAHESKHLTHSHTTWQAALERAWQSCRLPLTSWPSSCRRVRAIMQPAQRLLIRLRFVGLLSSEFYRYDARWFAAWTCCAGSSLGTRRCAVACGSHLAALCLCNHAARSWGL